MFQNIYTFLLNINAVSCCCVQFLLAQTALVKKNKKSTQAIFYFVDRFRWFQMFKQFKLIYRYLAMKFSIEC